MLENVKKGYLRALAQGDCCGMPGYRKRPNLSALNALRKMRLVGNKGRLTASGWREVRKS